MDKMAKIARLESWLSVNPTHEDYCVKWQEKERLKKELQRKRYDIPTVTGKV